MNDHRTLSQHRPWWLAALLATAAVTVQADHSDTPSSVSIPGSFQADLGCGDNWQPDCEETGLTEGDDGLWRGAFTLPAGDYEYKATMDGAWDENYGANAEPDGDNLSLTVEEETEVRFYYRHDSHWVADSLNHPIATAVGDFQEHLGCPNWKPGCMAAWLQDPEGSGLYTFSTEAIPAGDYEAKVALDEGWDESYGDGEGNNVAFTVEEDGDPVVFSYNPDTHQVTISDRLMTGDLGSARAHWLNERTLVWPLSQTDAEVSLHFDDNADLTLDEDGVSGGESLTLTHDPDGLGDELAGRFPHLAEHAVFRLDSADVDRLPDILTGQVAVSARDGEGTPIDATGVQLPGVLDDLYAYDGELGPVYEDGAPALHLWAPTAQDVTLLLYPDGDPATEPAEMPMSFNADTGVWSIEGDESWDRQYYRFEVDVYVPQTQRVETNRVTDPYTLGASTDGERSQLVNLRDDDLKPEGWDELAKPDFTRPEDMVVYETHVRDFSINDPEVPDTHRGTFRAFTESDSLGMQHLRELHDAGLSHIHLLPINDCATIPEDPDDRERIGEDLSQYGPASEEQQAAVDAVRANDAFNWCYDPHHFNTPEGSYATEADGTARILEFREMVQALNEAGLRVVVDVVYNHTSQSGLGDKSVLDKVVPGYYHRLNAEGGIERSTCCENTATEHRMMEKFMVDSVKLWAERYKVDSFRFDLMGHHSKANILKVQDALANLNEEEHGVNGEHIYLYGEGWNFGEVADDARFEQATQLNMAGTGVGTFNDRFRDAVRGGAPFDTGISHVVNQSFINGLYYDPNAENSGGTGELEQLLAGTDRIRIGLAGSLRDFEFTDWQGNDATGDYGADVGYTEDPQESINYIEKHDNETLFDINQYKIPLDRGPEDRVRVHNLGTSLVLMAQGVPFMQAGQELMRSKSMDRDSYDSGDWFNRLDFGYEDNGWGRGLPPAHSSEDNWAVIKPRLEDDTLGVGEAEIRRTLDHTLEMLRIRHSSRLFRLATGEAVNEQVSFHNTGADQKPALIALRIVDSDEDLDPERDAVMVLFNADVEEQTLAVDDWAGTEASLHPVQRDSDDERLQEAGFDAETGEFTIPARTTVVFERPQSGGTDEGDNDNGGGGATHPLLLLVLAGLLSAGVRRRR